MSTHPFHNSGRTNHLNVNWWIANDHRLEQSRMSKLNTHHIMKQQNFHLGIMKQLLGWLRTALTRIHDILVLWREQMTALWLYGISKKHQDSTRWVFPEEELVHTKVWVRCCAKSRKLHIIWEVEFDALYQMYRLIISTKTLINFSVTPIVVLDLLFLLYSREMSMIIEKMCQTSCVF